jgi:hypothetical protein
MIDNAAASLAPSEVILLHADEFAPAAGAIDAKMDLLHKEGKAQAKGLGRSLLLAAFLANEQAGVLRLEVRAKKALFGLRTVQALYADPTGQQVQWPDWSLEARIAQLVQGGSREVSELVYVLLGKDAKSYYNLTPDLTQQGLAARGLLVAETTTHAKIIKTTRLRMPESTGHLAAAQPVEPLRHLLASAETGRPDLWKKLVDAVDSGVKRRAEQDTSSSFND